MRMDDRDVVEAIEQASSAVGEAVTATTFDAHGAAYEKYMDAVDRYSAIRNEMERRRIEMVARKEAAFDRAENAAIQQAAREMGPGSQ